MMVFIAVPVIAPSLGQAVMLLTQWRGIFIVLMLYGVLALIWSGLRMPETLPVSERRSLAIRDVLGAFRQTVTNRQTMGYALAAGGVLGSLFAFVFSSQQVFTEIYGLGHYFPLAFSTPVSLAGLGCGLFRMAHWSASWRWRGSCCWRSRCKWCRCRCSWCWRR
jgi:DHA1 family bicyclomycin/chloramphenicol resistance-like MFS transporter